MTPSAVFAIAFVAQASLAMAAEGVAAEVGQDAVAQVLACKPELTGKRTEMDADDPGDHPSELLVKIAGRVVRLDAVEDATAEELRVFPADATSVLVAVVYNAGQQGEPRGSDSLWRVPCKQPKPAQRFVRGTDADFGHSALAADGRTLYYTGASGVFALDLGTRKSRRITRAALPYCADNSVPSHDVVLDLAPDGTLFVDRGCGYMWSWYSRRFRITELDAAEPRVVRDPYRMLASVAIDGGGGIWLSDGECDEAASNNHLLYSVDRGQHWRELRVRGQRHVPFVNQPVGTILTGKRDAKTVVVFQQSCRGSDAHVEAAWGYVSQNAGASFRPIAPPPDIDLADDGRQPGLESDPIAGIAAVGDSLADLLLFANQDDLGPWRSRDLGRSWKKVARKSLPYQQPPPPAHSAGFGDWHVTIERESLFLSVDGQPGRTRIYPQQQAAGVKLSP